jgi:hypothetical protein
MASVAVLLRTSKHEGQSRAGAAEAIMRREAETSGSFLAQRYKRATTVRALPRHSTFHVIHHSSPTQRLKWQ